MAKMKCQILPKDSLLPTSKTIFRYYEVQKESNLAEITASRKTYDPTQRLKKRRLRKRSRSSRNTLTNNIYTKCHITDNIT